MDVLFNRAFRVIALVLLSYIAMNSVSNQIMTNTLTNEVNHLNMKVNDLSLQIDTLKIQMEQLKETHPYMKK